MPMLDVTDVLLDPDFCEEIEVTRRPTTVVNGRTVTTPETLYFTAIVNPEQPDPFQLETDYEHAKSRISVHSPNQFLAASTGYLPDLIIWEGSTYIVKRVLPWSKYGAGFYSVEAELQDVTQAVNNDDE